jgi:hypothetical protein
MIISLHYCTYTANPCTANPPNMAQTRRARGSPRATGSSLSRPAARRQALSECPAPRSASAQSRCPVAYWLKADAVRLELHQQLKAATSPPVQPGPGRRRPAASSATAMPCSWRGRRSRPPGTLPRSWRRGGPRSQTPASNSREKFESECEICPALPARLFARQ